MEFFTINKRIAHYFCIIIAIHDPNASLQWAHNYRDIVSTQRTVICSSDTHGNYRWVRGNEVDEGRTEVARTTFDTLRSAGTRN